MAVDLSKVILDSNTPAFRNVEFVTGSILFSGTLAVPGASVTSLSASTNLSFQQAPALVNIYFSQDQISSSGSIQNDYAANAKFRSPPYSEIVIPVSSPVGQGGWPAKVAIDISGAQMTITLTAYNSGGSASPLVFVPTTVSIRAEAYLPTQ